MVWLVLRDVRATFIAAVALPLSAIPTFIGMYVFGFTLNVVSLLALSLVVGILVDDAMVEVENIVRHLRMGKSPYQATMDAAEEIGLAVVATTFALIAVFLPTAFMSGIVGRFFKQFGWTAAMAVFASLLVARLLTPMMAAYLLKDAKKPEMPSGWVMRRYLQVARRCLDHRWATLAGTMFFFIGSLMLIPLLPLSEFHENAVPTTLPASHGRILRNGYCLRRPSRPRHPFSDNKVASRGSQMTLRAFGKPCIPPSNGASRHSPVDRPALALLGGMKNIPVSPLRG